MIAACAAGPLVLAAGSALAQTTVGGTQSTPVATSTSGDIDVSSSGAINGANATPLVTIDSNNSVTIEGSLVSKNINDAVGVLLKGGNSGSLTSIGTIVLNEDYAASDSANSVANRVRVARSPWMSSISASTSSSRSRRRARDTAPVCTRGSGIVVGSSGVITTTYAKR